MSSALEKLAARAAAAAPNKGNREVDIPLAKIKFDPAQPRKAFHHLDGRIDAKDEAYIAELAQTIDSQGLIQAITVQELADGNYLVVVGECRTRAHLLLGRQTIRATVRNDLTDFKKRLVYQVSENLNRQDLTDDELAGAVRDLMKGDGNVKGLNQAEVARALGKSEGWVTRFVRFGDVELQKVWRATGIVDTPENLYRVSILPEPLQIEIQRRVALDSDHPDWIKKPILREVIESFALDAKNMKAESKARVLGGPGSAVVPRPDLDTTLATHVASDAANPNVLDNGIAKDDTMGQAFAASTVAAQRAAESQAAAPKANGVPSGEIAGPDSRYRLPEGARAAVLSSVAATSTASSMSANEPAQPPVNCRVSLANIGALLDKVAASKSTLNDALDSVPCSLSLPGPLAQALANWLAGIVVNERDVPATIQAELTKLY